MDEVINKPEIMGIPEYFIRSNKEPSILSNDETNPLPTIPIFDFQTLLCDDGIQLHNLYSACKDWGFFQLVNHGVSSELLEKLKLEIGNFFKLPFEEKRKYQLKQGDFQGYGTVIRCEGQKLDWGDRFFMITNPIERRKPNLFPQLPPSLRDTLETYISKLQKLGMTLLGLLGKAIKMDMKEVEKIFDDGNQSVRMTYYPPCPQPDLVDGINPHSDGSGITILNQANGVEGLEIKKNGLWIPITFLPDAFVINIGDIMEVILFLFFFLHVFLSNTCFIQFGPTMSIYLFIKLNKTIFNQSRCGKSYHYSITKIIKGITILN
ncbi:oxoglutarate-dependent flavonoid 7-O-demethylase 1-like isoform X1 [Cicer arietinum]|uniref:oxoglutarate-dependent flavonoid 7-O-demethylase 1-like isoform X1 n=1 Tax=Cicer arietinum TaxID=3827 RepID=UPI003CC69DBE